MVSAAAIFSVLALLGATPERAAGPVAWDPEPTTKPWQWQLQGKIDLSVPAPVYDISRADVESLLHDRLTR